MAGVRGGGGGGGTQGHRGCEAGKNFSIRSVESFLSLCISHKAVSLHFSCKLALAII